MTEQYLIKKVRVEGYVLDLIASAGQWALVKVSASQLEMVPNVLISSMITSERLVITGEGNDLTATLSNEAVVIETFKATVTPVENGSEITPAVFTNKATIDGSFTEVSAGMDYAKVELIFAPGDEQTMADFMQVVADKIGVESPSEE